MVVMLKRTLFFGFLLILCFACSNKNLDQVGREFKATPVRNSSLEFSGIDSITSVTTTSAKINWSDLIQASNYFIFRSTAGGPATLIASVAAPASQYEATGLTQNSTYTFRVNATDENGYLDINTATQAITTQKEGAFSTIDDMTTSVGVAATQSLDCADEYSNTPVFTVDSQSDSHANCSIVDNTVSCTPTTFTGHSTWSAIISVQCSLNGTDFVESFQLSVR